jgi:hypothetical protein
VVISAVALPALGIRTINDRSWHALHNLTLNWTLLVIGLRVAMNWQPIAAGVAWLAFLLVGAPSPARVYRQNEIAGFAPTAGHGLGQLLGEGLLLVLFAYAGRRWLRIRL